MSLVAFSEVWLKSRASGGTLLVLLAIADNAGPDDGLAWVGEEHLAAKSRLSIRQVRRAIDELKSLDELEIWEWNPGIGPWRNCYRVILGEFSFWRGVDPASKLAASMKRRPGKSEIKTRPKIPAALRRSILERDGFSCQHCAATEKLCVDHIVPWSKGGSDDPTNLQILCAPCNSRKGDKMASSNRTPTSALTGHPRPPSIKKGSKEPSGNRSDCPQCGIEPKGKTLEQHLEDVHGVRAA